MKKGHFGLVLCAYPILAFACVILRQPIVCSIMLVLAAFLEKDEWAGRQTFQAWILSLLVSFFSEVVPWGVSLFTLSFVSAFLSTVANVFSVIVYLAAIMLSVLAIVRVMRDQEANLPLLSDLAYKIYGKQKPRPALDSFPPPYPPQNGQDGQ